MPKNLMSYGDVKEFYNQLSQNPIIRQQFPDMGQMARWYREKSGDTTLMAGEHPSALKDFSLGFDKVLNATGLPNLGGSVVSKAYEMMGLDPNAGRQMGESLPRSGIEMGVASMGGNNPLGWGLRGLAGLSAGAKTYTDTDNTGAALISGGSMALMPTSMRVGAKLGTKLGTKLLSTVNAGARVGEQVVPRFSGPVAGALEKSFTWLGEQAGALANMEAANVGVSAKLSQMPDWSAEHWAGMGLQMVVPGVVGLKHAFTPVRGATGRMFRSEVEANIAKMNKDAANLALGEHSAEAITKTRETVQKPDQEKAMDQHGPQVQVDQLLALVKDGDAVVLPDPKKTAAGAPLPPPIPKGVVKVDVQTDTQALAALVADKGNVPNTPDKWITLHQAINKVRQNLGLELVTDDAFHKLHATLEKDGMDSVGIAESLQNLLTNKAIKTVDQATEALRPKRPTVVDSTSGEEVSGVNQLEATQQALLTKVFEQLTKTEPVRDETKQAVRGQRQGQVPTTDQTAAMLKAGTKWFLNPVNAKLFVDDPAAAEMALKEHLAGVSAMTFKKGRETSRPGNALSVEGGAMSLFNEDGSLNPVVEDQVAAPTGYTVDGLSDTGQELLQQTSTSASERLRQMQAVQEPFTAEEVARHLPKGDQATSLARLNAMREELMAGTVVGRYEKGGRYVLRYSTDAMQRLRAVFGKNTNDETIQTWIGRNKKTMLAMVLERSMKTGEAMPEAKSLGEPDLVVANLSRPTSNVPLGVLAKSWFRAHFLEKGYGLESAEHWSEIAMRVGTVFPEIDKLAMAKLMTTDDLEPLVKGIMVEQDHGTVGISDMEFLRGERPWNQFFKLVTLGHEAMHGVLRAYEQHFMDNGRREKVKNMLVALEKLSSSDKQTIMHDLLRIVVPQKVLESPEVRQFINDTLVISSENSPEFMANYGSLAMLAFADTGAKSFKTMAELRDHILFSPQHFGDFVSGHFIDVANVSEALTDYLRVYGSMHGGYTPKSIGSLKTLGSNLRELAKSQQEIEQSVVKMQKLYNSLEGGLPSMFGMTLAMRKADTELVGDAYSGMVTGKIRTNGLEPNWFEKTFLTAQNFAARYPICKPIVDLAFQFRGYANSFESQLYRPFMMQDAKGKWHIDPQHSGLTQILKDKNLQKGLNAVCLEQNQRVQEGKIDQHLTPQEVANVCKTVGLGATGIELINNTFNQILAATTQAKKVWLDGLLHKVGITVAHHFVGVAGHDASSAYQIGSRMAKLGWEAVLAKQIFDRTKDPNSLKMLQQLNVEYGKTKDLVGDPNVAIKAEQAMAKLFVKLSDTKANMDATPYYTPEVRIGKFFIRYRTTDSTKSYLAAFDTKAELEAAVKKAQANKNLLPDTLRTWNKEDERSDINLMHSQMAQASARLEQAAFDEAKMVALGRRPDAQDVFDKFEYVPGQTTMIAAASRGMQKYRVKRELTPGRETINFARGTLDYLSAIANGTAKSYTKDMAMLFMSDESMAQNPKVRNLMRDYISQVVDPPGVEWSKLKSAVFLSTIGLNVSSILVERLQPFFTLAPYLTEKGAGLEGSYRLIAKAMSMLPKIRGEAGKLSGLSLELNAALSKAMDNRVIDFGVYAELAHDSDMVIANLRNIGKGNDATDKLKMMTKPIWWTAEGARNLYTNATTAGNKIAFLASYILAKKQGYSPEQAYDFAATTTRSAMFGGGAAARPIGMFNNAGKFYSAVGAAYTLQHYTASTIGMMYRQIVDGFTKQRREGMTEGQIADMKKAAVQMLATQFAAAGAMGLPGVGFGLSLVEQLDKEADLKGGLRRTLGELGEAISSGHGEFISDTLMHGMGLRALGLGAIDLSGRFSLGNIMGLDSQEGFNASGMAGAAGGVLTNYAKGLAGLVTGQNPLQSLATASPIGGAKPFLKMLDSGWGQVRDPNGRLLTNVSDGEQIAQLLGFRPKAVSNLLEASKMATRANEVAASKAKDFHEELAVMLLNGQTQAVRQALMERARQDPAQLYDPVEGLNAVAKIAVERTTPKEPLANGVQSALLARESLARSFPQNPPTSAVQQYLARKNLERSVGLPGAGVLGRQELGLAQMADRLVQMHPGLSVERAKAWLEQRLGRSRVGITSNVGW